MFYQSEQTYSIKRLLAKILSVFYHWSLLLMRFRTDIYMKNCYGTMVVWLQNNAGHARWGPIESRVEALLDAFRPVREKERDKSQGTESLIAPPTYILSLFRLTVCTSLITNFSRTLIQIWVILQ